MMLFGVALLSLGQSEPKTEPELIRDSFRVHYDLTEARVPEEWDIKGKPLPEKFRKRCLKQIEFASRKYPKKVLQECLKDVFLLESLEFYGLPAAGTLFENQAFVVHQTDMYFDKTPFEQTFHEEVSSVLLGSYPMKGLQQRWETINYLDFEYRGVTIEKLKTDTSDLELSSIMHKRGFLYSYGMSDWENDFNSLSQYILTNSKYFGYTLDRYPVLCEKALLTIEFYSNIDSRWDWEYFHGLSFW